MIGKKGGTHNEISVLAEKGKARGPLTRKKGGRNTISCTITRRKRGGELTIYVKKGTQNITLLGSLEPGAVGQMGERYISSLFSGRKKVAHQDNSLARKKRNFYLMKGRRYQQGRRI